MALQDSLAQLQDFDLSELDLNNVGAWPAAVRGVILVLVAIIIGAIGYTMFVTERLDQIEAEAQREVSLKENYRDKAFQVANLDALLAQQAEMRSTFDELKRQLPTDTEVPGLLEDVTAKALAAGLKIESIDLEPERPSEIYIELPITIRVEGSYHDLARFVSGVSDLPRIVTLHDFSIAPSGSANRLEMQILARTYRYQDDGTGGS